MTGLRGYIRDKLPEAWEHVLRKHKLIGKFVEYVYQSLPDYRKGCKKDGKIPHWQKGIMQIECNYRNYKIYECFDKKYINMDLHKNVDWYKIHQEIVEYQENCR